MEPGIAFSELRRDGKAVHQANIKDLPQVFGTLPHQGPASILRLPAVIGHLSLFTRQRVQRHEEGP